jgi:hypothetical protein
MDDLDEKPIPVFVSYSHKDKRWLDRLLVHLSPLDKTFQIETWADTQIRPGLCWREKIGEALKRTKIAILLVSADFLASDFIRKHELPPLLESAELEGTTILSLIVSPCRYLRTQEISRFQAANDPDAPLISISTAEQEMEFARLANTIEDLVIAQREARVRASAGKIPRPKDAGSAKSPSPTDLPIRVPLQMSNDTPAQPLAWSVSESADHEPNPVTSVENFLSEVTWAGLLKIGNWIRDEQGMRIIGTDPKTYLLSQHDYGTEAFIIDTTLEFTNFRLPSEGKLGMNAGILFGWQYEREQPRYLNILLTGESVMIERCGFGAGRDKGGSNKLTKPVPLAIVSGEPKRFRIQIDDETVRISANGSDLLSAPRPKGAVGRVGIRPWRSKVDIKSFVVESM